MKLTLGEECLILRRRSGMFLSDVAKHMKLSLTTISLIELGKQKTRVSSEKALKYRDFLVSRQPKVSD